MMRRTMLSLFPLILLIAAPALADDEEYEETGYAGREETSGGACNESSEGDFGYVSPSARGHRGQPSNLNAYSREIRESTEGKGGNGLGASGEGLQGLHLGQ